MKYQTVKEKEQMSFENMNKTFAALSSEFHYKNKMAAPKMSKVVLSVGTGTAIKKDKNKNDAVMERLMKISGQKGALRGAKKSIASFKVRAHDPIGVVSTLRGKRMYAFLDKLINVALPRTKDFRGISTKVVDDIGNMTMGIKEHTIFPETADEDIRDVFGLAITLVSTAKTKQEGLEFFKLIGLPFKKEA